MTADLLTFFILFSQRPIIGKGRFYPDIARFPEHMSGKPENIFKIPLDFQYGSVSADINETVIMQAIQEFE